MKKDGVCVGIILFQTKSFEAANNLPREYLILFVMNAILLMEKEETFRLLDRIQKPIDYYQDFSSFLDHIMLIIQEASGIPFIVLRELRENRLTCLKAYGFSDSVEIIEIENSVVYKQAIEKGESVFSDTRDIQPDNLPQEFHENNILGFVLTPIKVGTGTFGTLTFAVSVAHKFTRIERKGFESIANFVGIAITNFRNSREAESNFFAQAEISTAITAVEIAQSAIHEVLSAVQMSTEILANLEHFISKKNEIPEAIESIDQIEKKLQDIFLGIQKIKTATKPPARDVTRLDLRTLWEETYTLMRGKAYNQDVQFHILGDGQINGSKEYVMHAFLNLILNSLDAFKETKKRHKPKITVTIDTGSEKNDFLTIQYTDNATGIDKSKLMNTSESGSQQISVNDVFKKGVTSKDQGSGFGLFLVRKILSYFKGSVELKDHRGGVTFEITFPKMK